MRHGINEEGGWRAITYLNCSLCFFGLQSLNSPPGSQCMYRDHSKIAIKIAIEIHPCLGFSVIKFFLSSIAQECSAWSYISSFKTRNGILLFHFLIVNMPGYSLDTLEIVFNDKLLAKWVNEMHFMRLHSNLSKLLIQYLPPLTLPNALNKLQKNESPCPIEMVRGITSLEQYPPVQF